MLFKNIEVNRKLIHLSSLAIPVTYYYISKQLMLCILIILFILILIWDILRIKNKGYFSKCTNKIFIRNSEKHSLSGAFYFLLSCLIGINIFGKYVFILSISVLIICDTMAALVGIKFGRLKIYSKTLEGAVAFFISGLIVVGILNFIFNMPIINKAVVGSVCITSVTELLSNKLKVNDNLLITLVFGSSYYFFL